MRDHNYFEDFARKLKMRPYGYVDTPEGRILLADSGEPLAKDGRIFYRTGYAVERNGLDFGNYHEYELGESGASKSAQMVRINEAVANAREFLHQLTKSGYYDGREGDFSKKPFH